MAKEEEKKKEEKKKIGPNSSDEKKKVKNKKKTNNTQGFKTAEVIVLVVLTCIISLTMGIFLHNRFGTTSDKYDKLIADNPELESFIQTYNDVIDNYYEDVDKEQIISDAIDGMFSSLDVNSNYLNQNTYDTFNKQLNGEYKGIGIEVINDSNNNIVIVSVFEDTPASESGLKPLDIIKSIDGTSLLNKETSQLVEIISNSKKDSFEFVITRDGEDKTIKVQKDMVVLKSVTSKIFDKGNQKIGYIDIDIFANNTAEQFKKQLEELENKGINSLIIDVRDNSGGHLTTVVSILSELLDKDHVIYQVETKDETDKYYSKGKETKEYPIVILANENSASASEVLMSALKEQIGSVIVGQTSFGKGTIQELQELKTGDSYKITTKKWLTSKGDWINEKGIEPDIEVALDDDYYANPTEENDNQLQTALQQLLQ